MRKLVLIRFLNELEFHEELKLKINNFSLKIQLK